MKHILNTMLFLLAFSGLAFGADEGVNVDSPNLNFENGFTNWELYTGYYYWDIDSADSTKSHYSYTWTPVSASEVGERFQVQNEVMRTPDPVIACSDFYNRPEDLQTTARIGNPNVVEGQKYTESDRSTSWHAAAERMVYRFTVAEQSTLLNYRFALALADPADAKNPHTGDQRPCFSVKIYVVDPVTKDTSDLPCGGYSAKSSGNNEALTQNDSDCDESVSNKPGQWFYMNWTRGSINLFDHVGKEVVIEIINHDCLSTETTDLKQHSSNNAGSHAAHGYFWAETRKLELQAKNCGLDDPVITASEGFTSYEWSRSDAKEISAVSADKPNVAVVSRSSMNAGTIYYCKMSTDYCSVGTLSTELLPVDIHLGFEAVDTCGGKVTFTNTSVCTDDSIRNYTWNFGDSTYAYIENPTHTYDSKGDYFDVTLHAVTKMGCEDSISQKVYIPYVPTLSIGGATNVCRGTKVTLTVLDADYGSKITWDDGAEGQDYTLIADTTRNFYVTVVDGNSCTYTTQTRLSVKPVPTLLVMGDTATCVGDTAMLVANNALSYTWSNGSTSDTVFVRPLTTTTYSVVGVASNGCTATSNITVNVNPLPTVHVTGPSELCVGQSGVLEASGASNYTWTDLFAGGTREVSPESSTKYTVKGVDENGCAGTASWSINVKSSPTVSFTGDTVVCKGSPIKLVGKGAVSYAWNGGAVATSTFTTVPENDTTYTLVGVSNGCSDSISIYVHLLPAPVIWVEGETEVCYGAEMNLTAMGADSYSWNNGTVGAKLTANPIAASTYRLIGTDANKCTATLDIPVTILPSPQISIDGETEICRGSTATLEASGDAIVYSWDNGTMGPVIYPVVNSVSTYTVTGTDANNCTSSKSITIVPVAPPTVSYIGDTVTCNGGSLTLLAQGATDYVWNDSLEAQQITVSPTSNTYVKLTGTSHNCSSTRIIQLLVNTPPNILISGDSTVCPGEQFTITADGAQSYKWNTGDVTETISYTPMVTTTYYVTGYDELGCSTTRPYTVRVRALPNIDISVLRSNGCPGAKDTVTVMATGGSYYEWSSSPSLDELEANRNSDKVSILIDEETTLYLYGRDNYGCENNASMTVTPQPRLELDFAIEPSWIDDSNPTVSFRGIDPADANWYWYPYEGADAVEGRSTHYRYDVKSLQDSVLVNVVAKDANGCKYYGEQYLYVWKDFWAPTGFTPNGDEKNETFHFYGGNYIEDFHFYIYNRLGEVVFEGNSFYDEWDGTDHGKECPWGIYGWVAKYKSNYKGINKDGQKKGMITVVR